GPSGDAPDAPAGALAGRAELAPAARGQDRRRGHGGVDRRLLRGRGHGVRLRRAHVSGAAGGYGGPAPLGGLADLGRGARRGAGARRGGRRQPVPPPGDQAVMVLYGLVAGAAVAALAAIALLILYRLCRLALDRRRLATWESAWDRTGPSWTTRR